MTDTEEGPALKELIGEYWDIAYKEGAERRKRDTMTGDAQRTWMAIEKQVDTLARQLAEARENVEKFRTQVEGLKALLEMEHSHRGRMNRLHEMKMKAAERRAAEESNRLDWIARQSDEFSSGVIVDAPGDGDYFVRGMGDAYATGKTFREAIDAAIAAGEKGNAD